MGAAPYTQPMVDKSRAATLTAATAVYTILYAIFLGGSWLAWGGLSQVETAVVGGSWVILAAFAASSVRNLVKGEK